MAEPELNVDSVISRLLEGKMRTGFLPAARFESRCEAELSFKADLLSISVPFDANLVGFVIFGNFIVTVGYARIKVKCGNKR